MQQYIGSNDAIALRNLFEKGDRTGLLGKSREVAKQVDVTQAPYFQLIKVALQAIKKDNC